MMVRRYVVKDMPEAIALIRKDLGKDAVILSTKKISLKKWLGFWRMKRIEVLAATGDGVPARVTPERAQAILEKSFTRETLLSVQRREATDGATRRVDPPPATEAVAAAEMTQSTALVEPTALAPIQTAGTEQTNSLNLDDVYREISDVKRLLRNRLSEGTETSVEDRMFRHLVYQGMNEQQIRELFAKTTEYVQFSDEPNVDMIPPNEGGLRDLLGQKILEQLQDLSTPEPIAATSRIVALVGPTGVGKTTTIAKLAALHVLSGQRRVGLITTDTFRIAAVEQLRTYARILNVPLEVVYQPSELQGALATLAPCDLIFLDTAGRNFRFDQNVLEIKDVLSAVPVDETCLVLSMTSKPEDLDKVAAAFQALPIDKFLFTKMDETSTYGSILNLLLTYRKPMSYLTTGQSVPDDIEVADIEKVLRLIFGGAA